MTRRTRKKVEEKVPEKMTEFEFEWVETREYKCNYVLSASSEEEARELLIEHLALMDKNPVDYAEGELAKCNAYEDNYFEHFDIQTFSTEPVVINKWEID